MSQRSRSRVLAGPLSISRPSTIHPGVVIDTWSRIPTDTWATDIRDGTEELAVIYHEYVHDPSDPPAASGRGDRSPALPDNRPAVTGADERTDAELLEQVHNAANGEKFRRLWRGSTAGYESHSEADKALCCLLAFWTRGDAARMDSLFRDSSLMRPNWDEVHYADGSPYGSKTLQ